MKKLLSIFLLFPFLTKSQQLVPRAPASVQVQDARLQATRNFVMPTFTDTTEANLYKGLDSLGAMINIRGTATIYVRQISTGTVKKWGQMTVAASNIYNIDGILTGDRVLSGSNTHVITFDSLANFTATSNDLITGGGPYTSKILNSPYSSSINTYNKSGDLVAAVIAGNVDSSLLLSSRTGLQIGDPKPSGPIPTFFLKQQASQIASFTLYWPKDNSSGTDTLATTADVRAGSGGGGSSNGIGRDTVQTYTSGTTLTQSASTNYIQVNPASVQATLTITTLASGGTWHTSNDLYIVFGGTVTSGNPVITSFTLTAGSGLTVVESASLSAVTMNAGDIAHYHKIGTILYRIE